MPLLLALGWTEQQLKLELPCDSGAIDIAGFRGPWGRSLKAEDCAMIIETKHFMSGLRDTHLQGKSYVKHFPRCRVLLVSNGYCYYLYARDSDGEFPGRPTAYLSLSKPTKRHSLDPAEIDGGLRVLEALLPNGHV